MTTRTYRKHFKSLKTEEERVTARTLRARQVAAKENIISGYYKQQRHAKQMQNTSNAVTKYTHGELLSSLLTVRLACEACCVHVT